MEQPNAAGSNAINVSANPLSKDINVQVQTKMVDMKDAKFNFRTDKESKVKRPTFELKLPLLTISGVIAGLNAGDKTTELIVDAVNDTILNRARGMIGDIIDADSKVVLTPEMVDLSKLTLVEIANLPKGERGAGISKEEWAAFVADYKEVMQTPEAIAMFPDKKPRSPDVLDKHGVLLANKFNQVRSRKDVVAQMDTFLDVWAATTKNGDEHEACYNLLKQKANTIMQGESFDDL